MKRGKLISARRAASPKDLTLRLRPGARVAGRRSPRAPCEERRGERVRRPPPGTPISRWRSSARSQVERVLVTGSGGLAGVNFVRALTRVDRGTTTSSGRISASITSSTRTSTRGTSLRGTATRRSSPGSPRSSREERADFLHPQPSSEAYVISGSAERIAVQRLPAPSAA